MKTFSWSSLSLFLFCLILTPALSQDEKTARNPHLSSRELARLAARLKTRGDDTVKVNILLKIGEHTLERLAHRSALDSANTIFSDAESVSRRINYDSGVVSSLIGKSRILILQRETELTANRNDKSNLDFEPIATIYRDILTFVRSKYNEEKTGDLYVRLAELTPRTPYNAPHMRVLFDSAAVLYHLSRQRDKESAALTFAGQCFHESSDLDSAASRYKCSIELMQGQKRNGLSMSYSLLGNTYLYRGDSKRAISLFQKAYDLSLEQGDTTDTDFGLVNIFIGFTYQELHETDQALKHLLKAMNVFALHDKTNSGDLIHSACSAAKVYISKKQPQAAIDLLSELQRKHPVVVSHRAYYVILVRLMSAYVALHDYVMAQKYFNKIVPFLASPGKKTGVPEVVDLLISTRQFNKADKYLTSYEATVKDEKPRLAAAYNLRHRLDSAQGNYRAALQHYTKYKLLSDSLMDEAKVKELAQLNVSFETEKKEQAIAELKRDAEVDKLRLHQERLVRNGIIGGAVILAILLILMFNLYQSKKKSSLQLQLQKDEIALKNNALERLINEKEWLLKEVHHRVKNNLHTIVSLLESQSIYLKNAEALTAIQDSQNRINAMSLIHQKLYQSESITTIDMNVYISELVHYFRQSFNQSGVRFELQVDDVELDVSQAIPVGLILNEAITNSMKYAFPGSGDNDNVISVHMKERSNAVKISIADNGVGFPPDMDRQAEHEGLGLQLINGLTRDLKGVIHVMSVNGVRIDIEFIANTRIESVVAG